MKVKVILLILFLSVNSAVYFVTEWNVRGKIELVLSEKLETLQTHYDILLYAQKLTAASLYKTTLGSDGFIDIMSKAQSATKEQKVELRVKLQEILLPVYSIAKMRGVLQYQFLLPNNISFLRMHKPSKFGDDLTDVRDDFRYTNKTKKPIRGFTQGRTSHGFRNVFPVFDKNNKYLGMMEVSFSSDNFQWYLNNISHIHTHFLVDKHIFDAKAWLRDDMIVKYSQSAESSKYMITLNKRHSKDKCIVENIKKLQPIKEEIEKKILIGDKFSLYIKYFDDIEVVSFLPIKNLENKTVAWLVSYEDGKFIKLTLKSMLIVRIVAFFVSLLLIYFLFLQVRSKEIIEQRHKLLNDILDATDNIMFITDFKMVSFSNNKFKNLFNIKHTADFNFNTNNNVLSVFEKVDGCLHAGLLKEKENLISLLIRTPEDERIVSILDGHLKIKVFKINISKTNEKDNYLVTLTDITKMQAKQELTKEKAYIDGLTRVYNRNKFDEIINEEIKRVKRFNHNLSIAILDIDKFKDFNDKYGHLIGDEVLIMVAQFINEKVRETDTFARWGGEEFVILFKETSLDYAKIVLEKLRSEVENLHHEVAGGVTISFGVTEYKDGDTVESLFKRCDDALYKAKANGRNRVEVL